MIRNALLSMLGVCASLPAQTEPDVIVVDQFLRPGAHYYSVVDAVVAARPGATILVRPGAYALPSRVPVVIDKPVRIVGLLTAGGGRPALLHPVVIRGVDVGTVELRSVGITNSCFGQCADGLQIHDCLAP